MKKLRIALLLLFSTTASVMAQETISATSGNVVTGSGWSASYLVGQVMYATITSSEGSVSQGTLQPYEVSIVTSAPEVQDVSLEYVTYPNPVKETLVLHIPTGSAEALDASLYDTQGKLINTQKVNGGETLIQMRDLPVTTYFLKISHSGKEIRTFKIIKN